MLLAVVFSEGKYCSSDGFWPQVPVFEEASVACDIGYLTRMCMGDMQWGRIQDHNCRGPSFHFLILRVCSEWGSSCASKCETWRDHSSHVRPRVHRSNMQHDRYLGHERHYCLRLLFLLFSQHHFVDCARDNGFAMTETENYASKTCTLGEAERLCNFGKWDKPDYANCCKNSLFIPSNPSQLQPPVPAGELQDGAVLHFPVCGARERGGVRAAGAARAGGRGVHDRRHHEEAL